MNLLDKGNPLLRFQRSVSQLAENENWDYWPFQPKNPLPSNAIEPTLPDKTDWKRLPPSLIFISPKQVIHSFASIQGVLIKELDKCYAVDSASQAFESWRLLKSAGG